MRSIHFIHISPVIHTSSATHISYPFAFLQAFTFSLPNAYFIARSAYFLPDESVIRKFVYSVVKQLDKRKAGITDRHRQASVCKLHAWRKLLWDMGMWKNEHNRQNGRTMQTRTGRRRLTFLNAPGSSCGRVIPRSPYFLSDESVIGKFVYSVVRQSDKRKVGITDRHRQASLDSSCSDAAW